MLQLSYISTKESIMILNTVKTGGDDGPKPPPPPPPPGH